MSIFVESLRRLYQDGKLNKDKIIILCNEGKITEEEKLYIFAQ